MGEVDGIEGEEEMGEGRRGRRDGGGEVKFNFITKLIFFFFVGDPGGEDGGGGSVGIRSGKGSVEGRRERR